MGTLPGNGFKKFGFASTYLVRLVLVDLHIAQNDHTGNRANSYWTYLLSGLM